MVGGTRPVARHPVRASAPRAWAAGGIFGRPFGLAPSALAAAWLLVGCAGEATPGSGAGVASDASADSKTAAGANISYSVQDGTTIVQWPEDEWPFHCVRLTQTVAGKAKPSHSRPRRVVSV